MKSVIVSGASATGKTTLIGELLKAGYSYLPKHTTRPMRAGEDASVHDLVISIEEFVKNYNYGDYFEESIEEATFKSNGLLYGTPRLWLRKLDHGDCCATPVSPTIARLICQGVGTITWVHLVCNSKERRRRLLARGGNEAEVRARMDTVNYWAGGYDEAFVFDTSIHTPAEIVGYVKDLARQ